MMALAPNLSKIVGTKIAARLIGAASSLSALSKIPAGNLQVIGTQKKESLGFSTLASDKHEGFIADCDLLKDLPKELQRKGQRLIATKSALAIRMDLSLGPLSSHQDKSGFYGDQLADAIQKTVDKWLEPDKMHRDKPLPVPKEHPTKRRGGKRVRRIKELTEMTDVRKIQNRVAFGVAEAEVGFGDAIKGLGLLNNSGAGGKLVVKENLRLREHLMQNSRQTYSKFSL